MCLSQAPFSEERKLRQINAKLRPSSVHSFHKYLLSTYNKQSIIIGLHTTEKLIKHLIASKNEVQGEAQCAFRFYNTLI